MYARIKEVNMLTTKPEFDQFDCRDVYAPDVWHSELPIFLADPLAAPLTSPVEPLDRDFALGG